MAQRSFNVRPSSGTSILGLLIGALFLYLLFRFAAFTVKALVSGLPIFFGIGLILLAIAYSVNKRVPQRFFQNLGATAKANPLKGFLMACGTVLFSPFVFGWLLAKALFIDKVKTAMGGMQQRAEEQMRQQNGGSRSIGNDDTSFTTVTRDDGMVIRIPKDDA